MRAAGTKYGIGRGPGKPAAPEPLVFALPDGAG
jgi:hypothetical protein